MRAKFRVMEITHHHEGVKIVRLRPVTPKSPHVEGGSEENRLFWEASPSGEADFRLEPAEEFPAEIGRAVYLDFEPTEDHERGKWWCSGATLHPGNGQLDVTFARRQGWGTQIVLRVQKRTTVRKLLDLVVDGFTRLTVLHGSEPERLPLYWAVTVTAAPE